MEKACEKKPQYMAGVRRINGNISNPMRIMVNSRLKLKSLNTHLVCVLCKGYYVEATAVAECLHTYCRSCIVKYLKTNSFCPVCDVQIHQPKLWESLRPDITLQNLVYKLVPGLYYKEMKRRRQFYSRTNGTLEEGEDKGYLSDGPRFFSQDDSISLSLEYYSGQEGEDEVDKGLGEKVKRFIEKPKRYLQCPAAVTIRHLKKFLRMKYGVGLECWVDIIYDNECLPEEFSLIDVAYTFTWNRTSPMKFSYRIFSKAASRISKLQKNYQLSRINEKDKKSRQQSALEQQKQSEYLGNFNLNPTNPNLYKGQNYSKNKSYSNKNNNNNCFEKNNNSLMEKSQKKENCLVIDKKQKEPQLKLFHSTKESSTSGLKIISENLKKEGNCKNFLEYSPEKEKLKRKPEVKIREEPEDGFIVKKLIKTKHKPLNEKIEKRKIEETNMHKKRRSSSYIEYNREPQVNVISKRRKTIADEISLQKEANFPTQNDEDDIELMGNLKNEALRKVFVTKEKPESCDKRKEEEVRRKKRKKSKHHEGEAKKRKSEIIPSSPSIMSFAKDPLKLKVKLTPNNTVIHVDKYEKEKEKGKMVSKETIQVEPEKESKKSNAVEPEKNPKKSNAVEPDKTLKKPNPVEPEKNLKKPKMLEPEKNPKKSNVVDPEKSLKKPTVVDPEKNPKKPNAVDQEKNQKKPNAVESEKNSKKPNAVEPEKSPKKPIMVDPEKSPKKPNVVEPEKSPKKPIVVDPEKSPKKPNVVDPEKSPKKPIVVDPEKSPKKPNVVEPEKNPKKLNTVEPEKNPKKPNAVESEKNPKKQSALEPEKTPKKPNAVEAEKNLKKPKVVEPEKNPKRPNDMEPKKDLKKPNAMEAEKDLKKPNTIEPEKDLKKSNAMEPEKDLKKPNAMELEKDLKKSNTMEPEKDLKKSNTMDSEKVLKKPNIMEQEKNLKKSNTMDSEKVLKKPDIMDPEKDFKNPNDGEPKKPMSDKERLLHLRAVRHKNIVAKSNPKDYISAPPSLTISKIDSTDQQPVKTSIVESRPSLEITLVSPTESAKDKKSEPSCSKVVENRKELEEKKIESSPKDPRRPELDNFGVLDLSEKSTRAKDTNSVSPTPKEKAETSAERTRKNTHQSILQIAQTLVNRKLTPMMPESSIRSGFDNSADSSATAAAMRNLKTLSDTAVNILMAAQSKSFSACPDPQKRLFVPPNNLPPHTKPLVSPDSTKSSKDCENGSGLKIPLFPMARERGNPIPPVPNLHEIYPKNRGKLPYGKPTPPAAKPGQNQTVRQIPNPFVVLNRQGKQSHFRPILPAENRDETYKQKLSSIPPLQSIKNKPMVPKLTNLTDSKEEKSTLTDFKANMPKIVNNNTKTVQNGSEGLFSMKNGQEVKNTMKLNNGVSPRKIENMTKNIESVAAGLTARAVSNAMVDAK